MELVEKNSSLLDKFKMLQLPDNYVVMGGTCLYVKGLREDYTDLDVYAGPECWNYLTNKYKTEPAGSGVGRKIILEEELIEIFDTWFPGEWDFDTLYNRSEVIDGIRYANLLDILEWKERRYALSKKEKDMKDIQAIKAFLSKSTN
ncbi:MAG: hypothetical protein Fur003_3720 [Candidatus Dojkabacteria bacterium]